MYYLKIYSFQEEKCCLCKSSSPTRTCVDHLSRVFQLPWQSGKGCQRKDLFSNVPIKVNEVDDLHQCKNILSQLKFVSQFTKKFTKLLSFHFFGP